MIVQGPTVLWAHLTFKLSLDGAQAYQHSTFLILIYWNLFMLKYDTMYFTKYKVQFQVQKESTEKRERGDVRKEYSFQGLIYDPHDPFKQ